MSKNLTTGSPAKLIFFFALPLCIGNLFQQVYNMADTLIVGRIIGVTALAGVGSTGSLLFMLIGFVAGMASGFSIITAQHFGARNKSGVRRSFCAGIVLACIVSVVLTVISTPFVMDILIFMNTPPEIIDDAYAYLVVIFAGTASTVLFNLLSSMIMALGDTKTPLFFLTIACLLNIALDFFFILYCGMGTAGAAWATVIAQMVSGLCCLAWIFKKLPELRPHAKDWQLAGADLWASARIGLPMGFQMSVIAVGAIILQIALNGLGPVAVAGYTAAQKIDLVAVLPMLSFGLAMATYTGQNFGARNFARIRAGVRQCCIMSISFSIVIAVLNITFGRHLIGIFVGPGQDAVVDLGQMGLTASGYAYWMLALLFIYRNTLQGLGESFVPSMVGVVELLMRAFAAFAAAMWWGYLGVCIANALAWFGAALPLGIAYYRLIRRLERAEAHALPAM